MVLWMKIATEPVLKVTTRAGQPLLELLYRIVRQGESYVKIVLLVRIELSGIKRYLFDISE